MEPISIVDFEGFMTRNGNMKYKIKIKRKNLTKFEKIADELSLAVITYPKYFEKFAAYAIPNSDCPETDFLEKSLDLCAKTIADLIVRLSLFDKCSDKKEFWYKRFPKIFESCRNNMYSVRTLAFVMKFYREPYLQKILDNIKMSSEISEEERLYIELNYG